MKKKFMRGIAAVLAAVMMMPTAAFATEVPWEIKVSDTKADAPGELEGDKKLFAAGSKNSSTTLTLTVKENGTAKTLSDVEWRVSNWESDIISITPGTGNKKHTATVTGLKAGTATVKADYYYMNGTERVEGSAEVPVTVYGYEIASIEIGTKTKTDYVKGQEISADDLEVTATFTDGEVRKLTSSEFTFAPTAALKLTDSVVTVTANGKTATKNIHVADLKPEDFVTGIDIVSPSSTDEFEIGTKLKSSDVVVRIYTSATKYSDATLASNSEIDYSDSTFEFNSSGNYTFSEDDITTNPVLTVKYAGYEDSVTLKVIEPVPEEDPEETKTVLTAYVSKQPTKTTYKDGETFAPAGLEVTFVYTDNTVYVRKYTSTTSSSKVMKAGDTSVTVSPTDDKGNSYTLTITGITVTAAEATINVTGLSTSSSYKHSLYTDATAKVGEELEWDDLFEYVYIKYKDSNGSNQYKKIKKDSELTDWLGTSAKLYAVVDSKTGSKKDIVEEDDIDDGEVKLELCFEYGSVDDTYEFNVKVDDIGCTVTICRSSSSSTKIGSAKTFDKLKDALEYLEDESDIIDDFGVSSTYKSSFVIKIKLGDDQDLGSFEFAPDHEHAITIDLADYDLELESDWIDYEDCEDLKVTITNSENYSSSDDDDVKSKMEYSDEDVTLVVDKNDTYTFSEGKIPGIYAVTVKSGITNGKVEANKTTVNHGGDVKFTITPNSGYEISDVKVNSKSVTKDGQYDVNSKGVATYTLKKAEKDVEITATFKKTATTTPTEKEEEKKPASTTTTWTNPFTDVSANAQYYKAVEFVCSKGLFNGMTATKFEPTTTMTRAMFVTVLGRLAGINEMQYSGTSFTDVSKSDAQIAWAAPYIEWAVQKGITNGTGNGKFSPNEPITHQQMYVFMQRYADKIEGIDISTTGVTLNSIKDASQIDSWAEDGVKFASKYGILITSGGKLTPTDNALRCELAMLLHGFCVKVLGQ